MKKGLRQVDWRKSEAKATVPRQFKPGEREKETQYFIKSIAPVQKSFRSKAAEEGKRVSPVWQPDDIDTENFKKSSGTAYLRNMD